MKSKRTPRLLKRMSAQREHELRNAIPYWQLKKGDKEYRLTHNELCLGYHFCYDLPGFGRQLTGPGLPGYNPKCDCETYDENCEYWNPSIQEPYVILTHDGRQPKE